MLFPAVAERNRTVDKFGALEGQKNRRSIVSKNISRTCKYVRKPTHGKVISEETSWQTKP